MVSLLCCKTITHVMLYIQHYIKTVHFCLKYNSLAILRKTTKLTEGSPWSSGDTLLLLRFLRFSQNPKSRDFLRFLPCFERFLELWANYNYTLDSCCAVLPRGSH